MVTLKTFIGVTLARNIVLILQRAYAIKCLGPALLGAGWGCSPVCVCVYFHSTEGRPPSHKAREILLFPTRPMTMSDIKYMCL